MRLTKEEIEERLRQLHEEMTNVDFGRDIGRYYALAEEKAMLTFALREGRYRRPAPAPKPKRCAHERCGKSACTVDICDDHDSNVGFWHTTEYCSLVCYVCDLKHAFDRSRHDDGAALFQILRSLK